MTKWWWDARKCRKNGHDIRSCHADPESGGEYLYCTRCGWGQTVYHG
jgi:hypothetical protein